MADLKQINLSFYRDAVDGRDLDKIDEYFAEDFVEHEHAKVPSGVELKPGREGAKDLLAAYLAAFKPFYVEVHQQYQDGDTVISRVTFHGTQVGAFARVAPTGRSFIVEGIDIYRFENGRIVEHWGKFDRLGMLAQLGAVPPMSDSDEPFYGKLLPF
jgi:predicted ester cyclase